MPYFEYEQHKVFYEDRGKGEPLLILPGNTATALAHEQEIAHFANTHRVISLDYLGTGRSDRLEKWPVDWWGFAADQAHVLIDHLAIQRIDLLGSSGGAVVALRMAGEYPERVRSVIADSFSWKLNERHVRETIVPSRRAPVEQQIFFWQTLHGDDWQEVVEKDTEMLERFARSGGEWLAGTQGRIRVPLLITRGNRDPMLPDLEREKETLERAYPQARIISLTCDQHPLCWFKADAFRSEVTSFLSGE